MMTSQSMALDSIEKNLNYISLSSAKTVKSMATINNLDLQKDNTELESFEQ